MIFADKIIRLRKKNNWSQEELAEKMDVSRQSVSKWESAQSVPDLQKILQLSQLFGVTTDYLLKDEIEDEEFTSEDTDTTSSKKVSLAEAGAYLTQRKKAANLIAFATFLCIISPTPLIFLSGATMSGLSENTAAAVGLLSLFAIVAVAVMLYINCGFANKSYEFLEKGDFDLEYGVKGMVSEEQHKYYPTYAKNNTFGTVICILSPVPLIMASLTENNSLIVSMVCVTMLIAAVGVIFFIRAGVRWASMNRLLKAEEFSPEEVKANRIADSVGSVYWMIVVAIYLAISFITNRWDTTWIIWPVAGVIFAAVVTVCRVVGKNKNENNNK